MAGASVKAVVPGRGGGDIGEDILKEVREEFKKVHEKLDVLDKRSIQGYNVAACGYNRGANIGEAVLKALLNSAGDAPVSGEGRFPVNNYEASQLTVPQLDALSVFYGRQFKGEKGETTVGARRLVFSNFIRNG